MLFVRSQVRNAGIKHSNADHFCCGTAAVLPDKQMQPFTHRSGGTPAVATHQYIQILPRLLI
jgi:hypothetical protein